MALVFLLQVKKKRKMLPQKIKNLKGMQHENYVLMFSHKEEIIYIDNIVDKYKNMPPDNNSLVELSGTRSLL